MVRLVFGNNKTKLGNLDNLNFIYKYRYTNFDKFNSRTYIIITLHKDNNVLYASYSHDCEAWQRLTGS